MTQDVEKCGSSRTERNGIHRYSQDIEFLSVINTFSVFEPAQPAGDLDRVLHPSLPQRKVMHSAAPSGPFLCPVPGVYLDPTRGDLVPVQFLEKCVLGHIAVMFVAVPRLPP